MKDKAVVLLSGGLDSAVTLFYAIEKGYDCHCLTFDYGQRHRRELESAKSVARAGSSPIKTVRLDLSWKGSSLTDVRLGMPSGRSVSEIKNGGIPNTYVPGRNTIFLSMAVSFAEAIGASRIFIGAHDEDSSGYPDCKREYLETFDEAVRLGTKAGIEGRLKLEFPVIDKTKREIVKLGFRLGVPFESTWSCYMGEASPCGDCDSCVLRARGFKSAGIPDPLLKGDVC